VLPNAIIKLSLWAVLRGVHASVVKTSIGASNLAVLAVGVVGIVRHAPAVLLVLVVVGVGGAVVGRSDTLRVRSRSPVVEVDLRARHVSNRRSELLAGPGAVPGTADADHPDEEDQHNHEEDGPGDTASDVGKLRLLGTLEPSEGACALAVRFSLLILEAESAVPAEAVARVKAGVGPDTSPVVAKLALAVEVVGRLEQADGIDVAEFLLALTD